MGALGNQSAYRADAGCSENASLIAPALVTRLYVRFRACGQRNNPESIFFTPIWSLPFRYQCGANPAPIRDE